MAEDKDKEKHEQQQEAHQTPHRTVPDSAARSTSRESNVGGSREGAHGAQGTGAQQRDMTDPNPDEVLQICLMAGAIAEVIEPVQGTRQVRTR